MNTPNLRSFTSLVTGGLLMLAVLTGRADIVYSSVSTNAALQAGVSFLTEMRVVTASNSLGAFAVVVKYDPSAIQIQAVATPADSSFAGNTFADAASFASGQTRVVGFRTTNAVASPAGKTAFSILWRAVGVSAQVVTITNIVEASIDSTWQANEVWSVAASIQLADLDTDSDGIPDWWMLQYFGHPTAQANDLSRAQDDPDGDGLTNLQEFQAARNPLIWDNLYIVSAQRLTNGSFEVAVMGKVGNNYSLQATTNLANWTTVRQFPCTNVPTYVIDDTASNFSKRFYRIGPLTVGIAVQLAVERPSHLATEGAGLSLSTTAPGLNYQIEASSNLANWAPFTTVLATNTTTRFRDVTATNANRRFYRAVVR